MEEYGQSARGPAPNDVNRDAAVPGSGNLPRGPGSALPYQYFAYENVVCTPMGEEVN